MAKVRADTVLSTHDTSLKILGKLHSIGVHGGQRCVCGKGGPKLLEPSKWWWAMRTEPHGETMLRDILRQCLLALETLHAANVTHRSVL